MKIGIYLQSKVYLVVQRSLSSLKYFVLLCLVIVGFPEKSFSKNYYVKSSGNDNNSGLSDDQAWRTIAKVNASSFFPGDAIFFNKGDTWREQLIISSSGNQTGEITFSSYGTGEQPKVLGSSITTVWTLSHKNVWYSYNATYIDPYSLEYEGNIYFKGQDNIVKWGRVKKNSWQDLKTEFDWTWIQDTLYIFSSTDPNSKYSGVEMAQREYCINLNNKAYITIDGFELAYSGFYGITEGSPRLNVTGLLIKNCHIHHIGIKEHGYGVEAFHSNTIIRDNVIHDSGRRNVSVNIYGADVLVNNILIERNTLYHGFHTTGVDISGYGKGTINNVTIRNNLIYDDPTEVLDGVESFKSVGIYAEKESTGSISNIYVYNNVIKNTTFNGILFLNIPKCFINNNVFYGVNPNLKEEYNALVQIGGSSDCTIRNNIFYNDVASSINSSFSCLHINSSGTVTSDYNLFFQHDLNSVSCIRWAGTTKVVYSIAEWTKYKTETGQDYHSPVPANPLFVSSSDFHLREGSRAIGAGVNLGLTTDYDGKNYHNPPSIGAFEYNSVPVSIETPVYQSSVVENVTPSIIELTYNLSLAIIVPAVSAFSIMVNSAARSVSSVSVSGTKVILTLATPIVNGDIVTVAYSKPSSNPLQTPEGGQAASISAQSASNRVNAVVTPPVVVTPPPVVVTPPMVVPNTAPVAVVNYSNCTYSGFVGELNASGSYDADKDNLSFTWKIPNNISVSATNSSVIEFLAPIVETKQTYEFTLTVSDGKTTLSKTIPVEVIPYQLGLVSAEVVAVEAGDFQTPYLPYNVIDGNIGTMWSAAGSDQWIILELKELFNIQHVKVAFQPGQKKESYFDILGSNDKESWEPVLTKSRSCDFSGDMQVFEFPLSKSEKEYKFIKLVGQGNSLDNLNFFSEFRIFGFRHKNPTSYDDLIVKIYPNPASEIVNILIDEPAFKPDFIKIVNLAGKTLFTDKVDPGIRQFQVPINFRQGVYLIQMGKGSLTMFTQKLVVVK